LYKYTIAKMLQKVVYPNKMCHFLDINAFVIDVLSIFYGMTFQPLRTIFDFFSQPIHFVLIHQSYSSILSHTLFDIITTIFF
jgi:hypothetical protein